MSENTEQNVQLRGLTGDYNNVDFYIDKEEFLIGRHFDCDLVMKEKTVSAQHAKIYKAYDHYEIEDLDSSNGTFVNSERIKKKRLRTEDIISFDKFEFRFLNQNEVARTVISDGEEFRKSLDQTEFRPQPEKKISNKEKSDTTPFNVEEIKSEMKKRSRPEDHPKRKKSFSRGIFLSLIMAYTFNIGFILLMQMIKTAAMNLTGIWNILKMILAGFPYFHFHIYWTNLAGKDRFYILSGIVIPVGLIFAGIIIQRANRGNRFRNAITFSFFYIITGVFLQLSVINFNLNAWISMNTSIPLGFSSLSQTLAIITFILYFWLTTLFFSLIGTFLSSKK